MPRKASNLNDILKQTVSKEKTKETKQNKTKNPANLSGENSLVIKINILCQPGERNKKYMGAMEGKQYGCYPKVYKQ